MTVHIPEPDRKSCALITGRLSIAVFDSGSLPSQDYNQAATYVAALTGSDANTAIIDIRLIHDQRKDLAAIPHRGTLRGLWTEITTWQALGYGCFVTINAMDGSGRYEIANVATIRCQAIDLDNLSAQQNYERATKFIPAPSFAVQTSPGKLHVYWLTKHHANHEQFTVLQRKLRTLFDGDRSVSDPSRVLRLPGTLHLKEKPHLITCWALDGFNRRIDPNALELSLYNVNVIDGSGGRHPLGEPSLSAPSFALATRALYSIDPNTLDRGNWISVTSAFKQCAWNFAPEAQLFDVWSQWCARYTTDDLTENLKNWLSIRETEIGWKSFERRVPHIHAETVFGERNSNPPPMPTQELSLSSHQTPELDGYEQVISSAGDNGKNTLIETVKLLHGNVPVAFDEFTQTVLAIAQLPWDKNSSYPRQWTDMDTIHCQLYVQALFKTPGKETVHDAITIIANRHRRHRVRDYFNTLQWDGVDRLSLLAIRYFGTQDTPYTRVVFAKFMIGAVARVMNPGCKMDNVIILEGAQGKLKSSSITALAGSEWFTDELPDLQTKDAAIQLIGKWVVEVSELSAFKRSDVETIKKFISRSIDRFRAPYDRIAADHPRQSVFIATTNDEHFLKDSTGNRRYWPLTCGVIDIQAIKQDRDQLWAEALCRYRNGERWWLDEHETKLAEVEQDER